MVERGREVLAVGRKRRLATRAQRLALLRRDGGCARPGCTESRIERLPAHHLRHWLHGGRTDLTNLVLLCDACHGLAHDLDLVMTRRSGRLVVTTPDGRRVWGTADTAFAGGIAGLDASASSEAARSGFVGVHPVDTVRGRRPGAAPDLSQGQPAGVPAAASAAASAGAAGRPLAHRAPASAGRRRGRRRSPIRRPNGARPGRTPSALQPRTATRPTPRSGRRTAASPAAGCRPDGTSSRTISTLLFPAGEPVLREAMHVNGERMDLRYVVSVLMGYRDAVRRWADESGVSPEADLQGGPAPR